MIENFFLLSNLIQSISTVFQSLSSSQNDNLLSDAQKNQKLCIISNTNITDTAIDPLKLTGTLTSYNGASFLSNKGTFLPISNISNNLSMNTYKITNVFSII